MDTNQSTDKKIKLSYYRPGRALLLGGLQEVEASIMPRQGSQPSAPAAFTPQEIFLKLDSVKRLSRLHCHSETGRVVNEKSQRPHRESNPRLSVL